MSEDTKEWLAGEVLRLGAEVRDLSISNAVLRQDNDELHKDYESLADEHTKLIERNKTLKAEVDALKLGSLLTAVDVLQFIKLKEENERLRKAGDAMAVMVGHIEITGDAHRMMLELSKDWDDAKEGKQP